MVSNVRISILFLFFRLFVSYEGCVLLWVAFVGAMFEFLCHAISALFLRSIDEFFYCVLFFIQPDMQMEDDGISGEILSLEDKYHGQVH